MVSQLFNGVVFKPGIQRRSTRVCAPKAYILTGCALCSMWGAGRGGGGSNFNTHRQTLGTRRSW